MRIDMPRCSTHSAGSIPVGAFRNKTSIGYS